MRFALLFLFFMQIAQGGSETRPKCANGQYIDVEYRKATSNEVRKSFEHSVGLDSLCLGAPGLFFEIGRVGDFYRYRVPDGHVQYWLEIFSNTPIVESASEYELVASVKGTTTIEGLAGKKPDIVTDYGSPLPVPQKTMPSISPVKNTRTKVEQFLRDRYHHSPDFHVLTCGEDCVHVTADQLRHVVIQSQTFWESLDIYVVITTQESRVNVHMIVDGSYATGVGNRAPALASYTSMEHTDYAQEFYQYANRLLGELTEILQKQG